MEVHMSDFIIKHEKPIPRIEQETNISYDKELDMWSLYTNNPPHARKWEDSVIPSNVYLSQKIYHADTGDLIALSGQINGSASVNRKREMTEEQRQAMSVRMKKLHGKTL